MRFFQQSVCVWLVPLCSLSNAADQPANPPPLEFKGLAFSQPVTWPWLRELKSVEDCPHALREPIGWCRTGRISYAGADVIANLSTRAQALSQVEIEFSPPSFDPITAALTEKYGAPVENAPFEIQTAYGVKYTNRKMKWNLPDGTIEVTRYFPLVTKGMVRIRSRAENEYREREEKKKPPAVKDL